jgi:hypothetical protein
MPCVRLAAECGNLGADLIVRKTQANWRALGDFVLVLCELVRQKFCDSPMIGAPFDLNILRRKALF